MGRKALTLRIYFNKRKGEYNMKRKWYLSTWFISIMLALWILVIPAIVGIVLLVMSIMEDQKMKKEMEESGFGDVAKLKRIKEEAESELQQLTDQKESMVKKLDVLDELDAVHNKVLEKETEYKHIIDKKETIEQNLIKLDRQIEEKSEELVTIDDEVLYQDFGFYETQYDLETSLQYKEKLAEIRDQQKTLVKEKRATDHSDDWTLSGSKAEGTKMNNENIKMTLYSFNTDCDNAIAKVKFNNMAATEKRITKSYDKLNKMNKRNLISIRSQYLDLKLEELHLVYEYELKKEEEREEQRRIKEDMREEERARKEIEAAKKKIEKEEKHFQQEIKNLQLRASSADDSEQEALLAKIQELESKLALVEKDKEDVFNREQNTRAGYVYIISNIGSFGENVYKIGLTRRLEPLDRVKELGDASVPFLFDVHAMIFSEDAPTLENTLHKTFHHRRVNKVNERKEFFRVTLEEIEDVVTTHHNKVVQFTKLAEAQQYRETLMIEKHAKKEPVAL